jgi:hypothetical protein
MAAYGLGFTSTGYRYRFFPNLAPAGRFVLIPFPAQPLHRAVQVLKYRVTWTERLQASLFQGQYFVGTLQYLSSVANQNQGYAMAFEELTGAGQSAGSIFIKI